MNRTYIAIISEHGVPNLQGILEAKPNILILVSSLFAKPYARRMQKAVTMELPSTQIEILAPNEGDQDIGEDLGSTVEFMEKRLKVKLDQIRGEKILNITGGTKLLSLAVLESCRDQLQLLHYIAYSHSKRDHFLQVFKPRWPLTDSLLSDPKPVVELTPLQQLNLYLDEELVKSDHAPNTPKELLLQLEGEFNNSTHEVHLWQQLFQDLRNKPSQLKNPVTGEPSDVAKKIRDCYGVDLEKSSGQRWVIHGKTLLQRGLNPEWLLKYASKDKKNMLKWDHNMLEIPHIEGKGKDFIRWLQGIWFEEVVYHWLLDIGIKPEAMSCGVKLKATSFDTGNEGDIFVLHKGKLHMLEIKCGNQETLLNSDNSNKLRNAARMGGKVSTAFVFSESIQSWSSEQFKKFKDRCDSEQTKLIDSKEALAKYFF